jgi:dipeptide/tripeptide permease
MQRLRIGIKSNVSALVAEQCTGTTRYLKQIGNELVIVDPGVTAQRIYMYFYFAINLGSLGSIITTTLEHKVGFWAAYAVPLFAFSVALVVALGGRRMYILRRPQGSIILDSIKAMIIAFKNGWKLDAAKPSRTPGVKWDDQFVEELKRALVACKVLLLRN